MPRCMRALVALQRVLHGLRDLRRLPRGRRAPADSLCSAAPHLLGSTCPRGRARARALRLRRARGSRTFPRGTLPRLWPSGPVRRDDLRPAACASSGAWPAQQGPRSCRLRRPRRSFQTGLLRAWRAFDALPSSSAPEGHALSGRRNGYSGHETSRF